MSSTRAERIMATLSAAFAPARVRVQDDSARHARHAGAAPGGQTHFIVQVVSPAFRGQSRLARARRVHDALAAEFGDGMHALTLVLRTPEEHTRDT